MATRLITLLLIIGAMQACGSQIQATSTYTSVTIGGEIFQLEIVRDIQSRAQGLMHRTEISTDGGMLFIFPDATERSFWMKHCLIPIDLLFLDSRGTVTATHVMPVEAGQEESESNWAYENRLVHYWSNSPARFAIELQSGTIQRLGLQINERIPLDLPSLRALAR